MYDGDDCLLVCLFVCLCSQEGYTFIPSKKATISDRVNIAAPERVREHERYEKERATRMEGKKRRENGAMRGKSNSHSGDFSESDRQPYHSFRISPLPPLSQYLSLILLLLYLSQSSLLAHFYS